MIKVTLYQLPPLIDCKLIKESHRMDKRYKVTLHFTFVTEVEAQSERFAISSARDNLNRGAKPKETNIEVEEIANERP